MLDICLFSDDIYAPKNSEWINGFRSFRIADESKHYFIV